MAAAYRIFFLFLTLLLSSSIHAAVMPQVPPTNPEAADVAKPLQPAPNVAGGAIANKKVVEGGAGDGEALSISTTVTASWAHIPTPKAIPASGAPTGGAGDPADTPD